MSIADLRAANNRSRKRRLLKICETLSTDTSHPCSKAQKIGADALAWASRSETHYPSGRQIAAVLSLVREFPPCFCGKPAWYRTGVTGYCEDHKKLGAHRREHYDKDVMAPKAAYFDKTRKAQDYADLVGGITTNSGQQERVWTSGGKAKKGHSKKPKLDARDRELIAYVKRTK